jgi:hypothetical protein
LLASITILSGAFPEVFAIYDDMRVYSNLFTFIVANAASGKGRTSACLKLVSPIEQEIREANKQEVDDYQQQLADLTKPEVKNLLAISGAPEEVLDHFEEQFDATAGNKTEFLATNLTSTKALEVKTPDVIVKVSPEKAQLIETRTIDGTPYILIEAADEVEINGILLKPSRPSDADDTEF